MHPALFFLPGARLSLPELSAARLDGHVVELGDAYVPADLVEGPTARAASLRHTFPPGTAASGPSAAWILGAGDAAPRRHHARRAVTHRLRILADPLLVYHDAPAAEGESIRRDELAVTSAAQTLTDLVFWAPRYPECIPWAHALVHEIPGLIARVREGIRPRVPGRRGALALLTELDQEEVTR